MDEAGEVAARDVAAGRAAPPATAGVYWFRDPCGGLLYVGSSGDLSRRVPSYFTPAHHPASKPARIARLAERIAWRTCGSVLEARVLEAAAIRTERPHFNRRLKQTGVYRYVRFDPRDPFPRLDVVRELKDGPWRYLGPFPGGRRLAQAVDAIADALALRTCAGTLHPDAGARACLRLDLRRCGGACRGLVPPGVYGRQLARALAALGGSDPGAMRAMAARGGAAPVLLPGRVRGALAALRAARIAPRILIVVPHAGAPGHRLLAVAGGRLRGATSAPDAAALRAAFHRALEALSAPLVDLIEREAFDEVRIVTAWLATPEGRAASIDVERIGREGAWAQVVARTTPGPLFFAPR